MHAGVFLRLFRVVTRQRHFVTERQLAKMLKEPMTQFTDDPIQNTYLPFMDNSKCAFNGEEVYFKRLLTFQRKVAEIEVTKLLESAVPWMISVLAERAVEYEQTRLNVGYSVYFSGYMLVYA
ncbi:unnamed protein product [Protopolystoma xenopodis]|uniref:Uncharacterized protein n=1 Tax=Protopolystoma xenopodis TaxID=117903 RepID=A0A3S5BPP6_9PLAT|nr:unnamed protein product [Protopolystoma xenopodis]